jgi:DNA ligase-1
MSTFDMLDAIKAAKGANAKRALIRKLTETDRRVFKLALDPFTVFYYQIHDDDIPKPQGDHAATRDEQVIGELFFVAEALSTRQATGNAAKDLVRNYLTGLTERQQNWVQRIINKDLNIGAEAKTYLKEWKGDFDYFELQLCDKYTNEACLGWIWQPKFDGLRGACEPDAAGRLMVSRNGLPLYGNDHIYEELLAAVDAAGYVPDGELMGRRWNDSISNARTKKNKVSGNFFNVFDLLTLEEWASRTSDRPGSAPLFVREARRKEFFDKNPQFKNIVYVESGVITPEFTVFDAMQKCIDLGYEGVVVKDPNSEYTFHRSGDWLKHKPRETEDLPIVGMCYGDPGTWCENTLGSIIVEYKGVQTKVGTGFSQEDRDQLLDLHLKGNLIGKTAEIKYQSITDDGKILFGSFKGIRTDK